MFWKKKEDLGLCQQWKLPAEIFFHKILTMIGQASFSPIAYLDRWECTVFCENKYTKDMQ